MATLKEHCPNCGGAIILFEGAITGTCDSCGTTYSLSDLQKIKELLLTEQTNPNENYRDLNETKHYESALDINEADEFSLDELCKKAETALESEQWQVACRFSDEILRRNPKFAKAYLYRLLAEYKVYKKEALANLEQPFDSNDNCRLLMRFAEPYLKLEIETYCKAASDKYHAKTLEDRYQTLCKRLPTAATEKHYQDLANGFHSLGNYKECGL